MYGRVEEVLDALAPGRPWRLEPMGKHVDSLSGSPFERAVIERSSAPGDPGPGTAAAAEPSATAGDERYIVKHISRDLDWLMRVLGDGANGARPWALVVWQDGLLDRLPDEIDHVTVGMAYDRATGRLYQVMRDVGEAMVPPGSDAVPLRQHRRFLDHLAALHAAFWGFRDEHGLITPVQRYGFAHPSQSEREATAGYDHPVPQSFPSGWRAVAERSPEAAEVALAIAADPSPLAAAMALGPQTLVHGDWKLGNLGTLPDGRTVLLDWGWPGQSGPCADLGWYLAVNCDRLPESKEDAIAAYRSALESRGVATGAWWQRQLELALLGAFVQLGWSKAGNPDELAWWTGRAVVTARTL